MAVTQTIQFQLTILDDGQIQLRRDVVYMDGTEEIGRKLARKVLSPGDDVSSYPQRVQNICAAAWPKSVVDAFAAAKAARLAAGPTIPPTP